jgi:hypothetical protein
MGASNPLTSLMPDLTGIDPDDSFSTVPYEKGQAFLWYLEDLVGGSGNEFLLCLFDSSLFSTNFNVLFLKASSTRFLNHT